MSHIDVATSGTDYLCQVFVKIIGRNIYLEDVIFSKEDTNYTEPLCIEKSRLHQPQQLWVESNGAGGIFATNIQPYLYATSVIPYHQSSNKHAKIISNSGFIKRNVYFRSDYEVGSDYDLFLRNLMEFSKDKKNNLKIHDDAPDSLSSLVKFIQEYLVGNWD